MKNICCVIYYQSVFAIKQFQSYQFQEYQVVNLMGNCQKQESVVENVMVRNVGPVCEVRITNYVWQSAYQGLFDYQSSRVKQKFIVCKQTGLLDKSNQTLTLLPSQPPSTVNNQTQLFQLIKKGNYFKILPIYMQMQQLTVNKLMWLIVRTLPNQVRFQNHNKKYTIMQKDIIKFGKQKIKIKELVPAEIGGNQSTVVNLDNVKVSKQVYEDLRYKIGLEHQHNCTDRKQHSSPMLANILTSNEVQSVITTNQTNCRICLQPGNLNDPLISPCKCTGSVRYLHLKCLRMWLGKRLNVTKSKHCITLNWQKLTCEMCKQPYKYRIYLDNKKFYTVEIPKPQKPYIVFQVIKRSNDKSSGKIYQFISLAEKPVLSIGRKKDVDVRISDDISVSRHHASISYDVNTHSFVLEDNKSKFGTLVLIKKNLCVRPNTKNIGFQMGADVFRFQSIRGPADEKKAEKNQIISDEIQDYLNLQDQSDDEFADNENSQDSEGRFQQHHEEEEEEQIPISPELRAQQSGEEIQQLAVE